MLLEDKVAIVYGGAGAVGRAVARAFVQAGARVHLAGRTRSTLETAARDTGAVGVAVVDADDPARVDAHAMSIVEREGRLDVVFDAIGMQDVQGAPLTKMPLADFMRPITVGLRTKFNTATAAARVMQPRGSGVIMTITAGPSRRAATMVGGFDPACAGIESLWRSLAAELGPSGVRLVVVGSAGSPDTPDVREVMKIHARANGRALKDVEAEFGTSTLLKRLPGVMEVARTATMMASDYASAMTAVIANATCGYIVD